MKINKSGLHKIDMKPKKIWIIIPTLQREALLAGCLESLMKLSDVHPAKVLLVDNDAAQSSRRVFDDFAPRFPFPFGYACEPERGLSRARNLGVEAALEGGADAVMFVDDDMRLPPDYLAQMADAMEKLRADAVRGKMRVIRRDGDDPRPQRRVSMRSRRDMLQGNGPLIAARVFGEWGLRFDERMMRGFEDGDFFYRAYLRGARIFQVDDAWFAEVRENRGIFSSKEDELSYMYGMRRLHVAVRRRHGGLLRAWRYVAVRGLPLLIQMHIHALMWPFAPRKRARKIQEAMSRIKGLIHGLSYPIEKH